MAKYPDIFDVLVADHERHRALMVAIDKTHGESEERAALFEEFTREAKAHAAAEEQALYSTVLRKPALTGDGRHSVAEHHEIEEALDDLAATDMASGAWLTKFRALKDRYSHHLKEEEEEYFPKFEKALSDEDAQFMRSVFERRKPAEKRKAQVTPEKKGEGQE